MTNKEAIEVVKAYRDKLTYSASNQLDGDIEAFDMAIKALEQENVLNEMFENIKTEIDFIPTYGAKFADGSINVHVNKKDVLQIIDKYRGEVDCHECKAEYDCYECEKYEESEE